MSLSSLISYPLLWLRAMPNRWITVGLSFSLSPHCKKGYRFSQSPAGMSLTKLSLAGKNLIIPGQVWDISTEDGKIVTLFSVHPLDFSHSLKLSQSCPSPPCWSSLRFSTSSMGLHLKNTIIFFSNLLVPAGNEPKYSLEKRWLVNWWKQHTA